MRNWTRLVNRKAAIDLTGSTNLTGLSLFYILLDLWVLRYKFVIVTIELGHILNLKKEKVCYINRVLFFLK